MILIANTLILSKQTLLGKTKPFDDPPTSLIVDRAAHDDFIEAALGKTIVDERS